MALHKSDADLNMPTLDTSVLVVNYVAVKKIQANMKEQRETNNASPAVPVNLQMWPSAPREEEKGEAGGGAEREEEPPPGSLKPASRSRTHDLALPAGKPSLDQGKVPKTQGSSLCSSGAHAPVPCQKVSGVIFPFLPS